MNELTPAEAAHISKSATCPDCHIGFLLLGPRAALRLEARCDNPPCGHEFRLVLRLGDIVSGERLDRNKPELYSKQALARGRWK